LIQWVSWIPLPLHPGYGWGCGIVKAVVSGCGDGGFVVYAVGAGVLRRRRNFLWRKAELSFTFGRWMANVANRSLKNTQNIIWCDGRFESFSPFLN
jgi:hypothetical protein